MQKGEADKTVQGLVQLGDAAHQEPAGLKHSSTDDSKLSISEIDSTVALANANGSADNHDLPSQEAVGGEAAAPQEAVETSKNEEEAEEYKPRSIAAITQEEKRKRMERRKSEAGARKNDGDSDSDFRVGSEDEESYEDEEEVEDMSDDEYSESEAPDRGGATKSGRGRRGMSADDSSFFVARHVGDREEGTADMPLSLSMRSMRSSGDRSGLHSGGKRKYNRFNRRNLSFDDRCQQLLHFKSLYGHCHVKRTHPGETKGLAYWVERQRMAWRKGTLESDKKKRLDDIGFVWEAGINGSGSEDGQDYDQSKVKPEQDSKDNADAAPIDAPDFDKAEVKEKPKHREEHVIRRGRLKLEEAKTFDDWCALLQEFKDKHGHCDVKRRYFGKNKGLAYWAERQRASRRRGTLEEEKIARLDSMGFVWGNAEGTAPRRSSSANDSLEYSYEASAEGDDEAVSPVMSEAPTPIATSTSVSGIASADQLDQLRRRLSEEERKLRTREQNLRSEKKGWEEESINLQLENCLLKEKLMHREEELKARGVNVKRKLEEMDMAESDRNDDEDEAYPKKEKRPRTNSTDKPSSASLAKSNINHAKDTAQTSSSSSSSSTSSPSSGSGEPSNLWALLCAIEKHMRHLVEGQKALNQHQRAVLDARRADDGEAPKKTSDSSSNNKGDGGTMLVDRLAM